ncbi:MAG: 2,3-bisphosphoglycerate-independent phosphoglycerate mutase [Oligoflexia bacterium]|nr:2,3-bisphosphoglycerate-independent phosphoglycerate mutase [Oligoflexia bacterium]
MSQKAILIVLDGFGIGKDSKFNAINNAKMPFYRGLISKYPHSQLITHGEAVGLPEGVMGNSEVGHMTMGAGRIVYQDLSRISKAIRDHEFSKNPVLRSTLQAGANGRVHLMGLISDGGVHSTLEHLFALLDLSLEMKIPRVVVHCFLDGRDTPPDSALGRGEKEGYLRQLLRHPAFAKGVAKIGSVMGRYFAMDRDKRWDRIERAYRTMTGQVPAFVATGNEPAVLQVVRKSYESGKSDEFVEPVLLDADCAMRDGDSVVFFNYRSDRAREITTAITEPDFKEFDRGRGFKPSAFAGMAQYDKNLQHMKVAFPPQSLNHIFGEWLEEKNLTQFRVAETEKYAHVTFFFNGGREAPFHGEDRVLIPSPRDVATYDLKPEMSALGVADEAAKQIRTGKYDFLLMNFANADMVGHTGNYEAAVRAVETLDTCLSRVIGAAESSGYHVLLTADHGNAEEMCDSEGHIHTQHTLNPVPALWVAPGTANAPKSARTALNDGGLADIMPTLCDLMKLPIPPEVTGKSLLR